MLVVHEVEIQPLFKSLQEFTMVNFVLADATHPYSFIESWLYDRIIAPAVASMMESMHAEWTDAIAHSNAILDVGCGGGQIMAMFAKGFPDSKFVGVDLSEDQVRRANRRVQPLGSRVSAKPGSALALPFRDGRFDVVYSIASIKHWSDKQAGLQECGRVLKPGGRLLVVEVDRACTLPDTEAFISRWKMPALMRLGGVAMFRTWVAGHSLDLLEARALAESLPLQDCVVKRVPGTPAFLLQGTRR